AGLATLTSPNQHNRRQSRIKQVGAFSNGEKETEISKYFFKAKIWPIFFYRTN
ncbi:hypothetical protein Ddye_001627, partial [Dipteronia dyeriana]